MRPWLLLWVSLSMGLSVIGMPSPAPQAITPTPTPILPLADTFSPPLGFRDGIRYGPHHVFIPNGALIEDTRFGVQNPDLKGDNCFGVAFSTLYHAGEDWYRRDGYTTAGAEVTAMAAGQVVFINNPGRVVILKHRLPSGRIVYSVYTHLEETKLSVAEGRMVQRGQRLGEVRAQPYVGQFREYHLSRDDSHLHFEIRYFFDASAIYTDAPNCNGLVAGRGYTMQPFPENYPAPEAGYVNPHDFFVPRCWLARRPLARTTMHSALLAECALERPTLP